MLKFNKENPAVLGGRSEERRSRREEPLTELFVLPEKNPAQVTETLPISLASAAKAVLAGATAPGLTLTLDTIIHPSSGQLKDTMQTDF